MRRRLVHMIRNRVNLVSPRSLSSAGFTLIEIVVVMVIFLVLLAFLIPQVQKMRQASLSIECASRLRGIGGSFLSLTAEQEGGVVLLFRDGTKDGDKRWYNQLRQYLDYSQEQARAEFGCPSFPVGSVGDWFCYGFRVSGSPGVRLTGGLYRLPIYAVENPSTFMLAGDTLESKGRQTFRIIPPGLYSGGGIHMRHRGRANMLFLDGHIESLDATGLKNLGITQAYDSFDRVVSVE